MDQVLSYFKRKQRRDNHNKEILKWQHTIDIISSLFNINNVSYGKDFVNYQISIPTKSETILYDISLAFFTKNGDYQIVAADVNPSAPVSDLVNLARDGLDLDSFFHEIYERLKSNALIQSEIFSLEEKGFNCELNTKSEFYVLVMKIKSSKIRIEVPFTYPYFGNLSIIKMEKVPEEKRKQIMELDGAEEIVIYCEKIQTTLET